MASVNHTRAGGELRRCPVGQRLSKKVFRKKSDPAH